MRLYPAAYRWYSAIVACLRKNRFIPPIISTSVHLPVKYTVQTLFFIILACYFASAHSQDIPAQAADANTANLSDVDILAKAKNVQHTDQQLSATLANAALRIAIDKKHHKVSAQAHALLGTLAQQANNIEQAMHHFLQTSLIYKNLNDKHKQILSSLDYAKLFFDEQRYEEGYKIINELLPIAEQYADRQLIALTLITQADSYYQQDRYEDAIAQYTHALTYLTGHDEGINKHIALTYHQIAQSYKHLNNNDQSIVFYKKSLDQYTALNNQESMARSLNNLAMAERYRGNYVNALDYSIRGLEIQRHIDDPIGLAKALTGVGRIYRYIGRYDKSLSHIHEAHLYYKKINDINNTAETSNQMGLIYTRLKQFDQARSFYQLTIDLPASKLRAKIRAAALREIAVIDLHAENYKSAMVMATQALKIYQDNNDKSKASVVERIIGNIFRDQDNDTQAIVNYRKALSLASEIGDQKNQLKALNDLGRSLITKNTDEATVLLKKALTLAIQSKTKTEMLDAYRSLRLVEKRRGNIAQSLRYAEEEISLAMVIQKEREANELVLAKANIHSHKIEIELESLKEKAKLVNLELAKKTNEIEIAEQANQISELELTKNRYANFALAALLVICLLAVIFIYRRFIDSRKRNRELKYLAARDPLTNCYNRRILFDLLNRDFSDLELLGEYCIIMADIDHFKTINDTYGHNAGDAVLCGVATIMQNTIRQNDIAARYGGEEFCLVLPGAELAQAMRIAETIRKEVAASHFDNIKVSCSFGVTSIHFNAKAPTELIDQADLALYKSKANGRNQVTVWSPTLGKQEK